MEIYTGLRFKGIVKKQFREEFKTFASTRKWENAIDKRLKDFAKVSGASLIFSNILIYMPEYWQDFEGNATNKFNRTYDDKTGYWAFQCSLVNDDKIYGNLFDLIPYFIESIKHCEVHEEGAVYSQIYELINGRMQITNRFFK